MCPYHDSEIAGRKPVMPPPPALPTFYPGLPPRDCDLKTMVDHQVSIWLNDGSVFWMVPIRITEDYIYGYIWRNDEWVLSKVQREKVSSIV